MRMQRLYKTLVRPAVVLLALVGSSTVCAAEGNAILAELKSFFEGAEVRTPGSAGNLAIESKVAKRFADSGFVHGEIKTQVASFLPGKTVITVGGLTPMAVMPMHPTLFRPGNFKQREFEAPLVYLGRGDFEDLKAAEGIDLSGAIALMEFDSAIPAYMDLLADDELFLISSDHGNDPTTPGTDHSREYVPLLARMGRQEKGGNLGVRETFADIGATLAEFFGLTQFSAGNSFLEAIT